MSMSDYDWLHVDEILRGEGDWFGAQLLRLIAKADDSNRRKLYLAFPEEVTAYEWWLHRQEMTVETHRELKAEFALEWKEQNDES